MAQLHIVKPDKQPVGDGALPDAGAFERPETDAVQIRFHIQKQAAAGQKIHFQDIIRKRLDCMDVFFCMDIPPFNA